MAKLSLFCFFLITFAIVSGALCPPGPSSARSKVRGKSPLPKWDTAGQMWTAGGTSQRQPGAAIAIVLRGLVHNLHTVGLWEQLGAITAHEKKGTGLGKWWKSKGTTRFITGRARQPFSRASPIACPCSCLLGRSYSARSCRRGSNCENWLRWWGSVSIWVPPKGHGGAHGQISILSSLYMGGKKKKKRQKSRGKVLHSLWNFFSFSISSAL